MEQINAEVFVTVASMGSYRKAADELGYTQAGISYIINAMEEKCGFKLFEREYGGVRLTAEGEELLPAMKRLFHTEKDVDAKINDIRGLETGHIRLISFNTAIVCLLPDVLMEFREQYPNIDIEVLACDNPKKAVSMISNGDADCAFIALAEADGIEMIKLREEPDVVVVSENHPLANKKECKFSDLEQYPFIGNPEEEDPYVYDMARKLGIKFNQIMTTNNDYGSFSMISKNLGFGIYPKIMAEKCTFPVVGVPIKKGYKTPFSIGIRSYKSISLAAKKFVDYAVQKLQQ